MNLSTQLFLNTSILSSVYKKIVLQAVDADTMGSEDSTVFTERKDDACADMDEVTFSATQDDGTVLKTIQGMDHQEVIILRSEPNLTEELQMSNVVGGLQVHVVYYSTITACAGHS